MQRPGRTTAKCSTLQSQAGTGNRMQLVAQKNVASMPLCAAPHCPQSRESERMSCEPATGVPTLLRRRKVHPRSAAAGAGHVAAAGGRCRLQAGETADPDLGSNAEAVDRAAAQAAGGSCMLCRSRGSRGGATPQACWSAAPRCMVCAPCRPASTPSRAVHAWLRRCAATRRPGEMAWCPCLQVWPRLPASLLAGARVQRPLLGMTVLLACGWCTAWRLPCCATNALWPPSPAFSAHLEGARQITIEGAYHSPLGASEEGRSLQSVEESSGALVQRELWGAMVCTTRSGKQVHDARPTSASICSVATRPLPFPYLCYLQTMARQRRQRHWRRGLPRAARLSDSGTAATPWSTSGCMCCSRPARRQQLGQPTRIAPVAWFLLHDQS